ncbi:hypothetical protein [Larkinella rosea]|uniref:Uncharacterized protein n=1 Tax=Larkinella rosea TaxID=2025312 RepID=A0A3P1BSZ9_9BACT|nr:hypothetical protein [Larkinella rosea]RRB04238.1 hypothetical protein EHT25_12010 [Larkinella rosea]
MKKSFVINSAKQLLNSATINLNVIAKNETSDNSIVSIKAAKDGQGCCEWVVTFHGLQSNALDQLALS